MSSVLLRCLGRAIIRKAPRLLLGCLPFGEALYEIATAAMEEWRQSRTAPERRAELEQLANITPDAVRQEAAAVAREVASSPEERTALAAYLERLPGVVRRSLSRPDDMAGRTVPAGLPLERAEHLVPFLPVRPPAFKPGDRLTSQKARQWELIELVGNGGFGEVWRARCVPPALTGPGSPNGHDFAIKFCLDSAAVATLRTEAALLQRVMAQGEGGLVPLRDVCLEADPPFLVYDYIPGGELTRLIRGWHPEGERPPRLNGEATRLVHYLANILVTAHGLNPPVVHRDLKPSNILLQPTRPRHVRPRVADFGIGGVAALQALTRATATSAKEMLTAGLRGAHTPLYASPQQMDGEPPDPRDDIYALGVIWYQVLTGDTTVGPPTDWREELSDRDVPPAVLDALAHCLTSDAKRRVANAAALATLLQPLLEIGSSKGG